MRDAHANMQKRVLVEADLTFKRALELAQGMEATEKNAKALKGTEVAVKQVSIPQRGNGTLQTPCYRCGRGKHNPRSGRFAEATCHNWGKKGHTAPVCRSGKKSASDRKPVCKSKPPPRTKYVTTLLDTEEPAAEEFQLFNVTSKTGYSTDHRGTRHQWQTNQHGTGYRCCGVSSRSKPVRLSFRKPNLKSPTPC